MNTMLEPPYTWQVIDVELAYTFNAETKDGRDCFKRAIELMGHTAVIREVPSCSPGN